MANAASIRSGMQCSCLTFIDKDHIVTMGHSGGGMHTMGFAIDHQDEIFLQVNLGMNMYGPETVQEHNFNFINILGDSD